MALSVAVVGLGNMGLGMMSRLAAAGLTSAGYDVSPARCEIAARQGLSLAGSVAEAVDGRELVVLSVPGAAAAQVCAEAFISGAAANAVLVDTSTIAVADSRALASAVAQSGRAYLDAPVSGGPAGAAAGTLTMMVGGNDAALARVTPVLSHIAGRIVHVGDSGAGQVAKLANNLLLASHLVAAAEAMRMVRAAGVAPEAALAVVNTASGRSAATEINFPRWILSDMFDSGFTAGLMRKDVRLALALAEDAGVQAPVLARAAETWLARSAEVSPDADFNRVAEWVMAGGDG